ncbi:uncharacterized protein LOC142785377 [Rhipicephalus microplus]|uniref:uncharacterized protein LOC142785377 n=1 Tax=Rhipicephalus microplus TaxID=6941 RepID=UPI003F6A7D3A
MRRAICLPFPPLAADRQLRPLRRPPCYDSPSWMDIRWPHTWRRGLGFDDQQNEQIAVLFAFLKELNDRGCVSRIVCESTAGTTRFGMLGNVTKDFFDTNAGVTTGAVSAFVAAARTGRSEGIAGCAKAFRECTADLPHVLRSVDLM